MATEYFILRYKVSTYFFEILTDSLFFSDKVHSLKRIQNIFWQATIIDTIILIDDKSLDCVLDNEALDLRGWISKNYIVVLLIIPKRVTAIVYRYIQEDIYSTTIRGSIVLLTMRIWDVLNS